MLAEVFVILSVTEFSNEIKLRSYLGNFKSLSL